MHGQFYLLLGREILVSKEDSLTLQGTKAELQDAREQINDLSQQQEALQDDKAAYKAEFANLQEENELLSGQVSQICTKPAYAKSFAPPI